MTQNNKESKTSQTRKFSKVSVEHSTWLASQEPCVMQLYFFSISSEQFGDRFEALHHTLSPNSFKKARKILESQGLFEYQEITGRLPSGKLGIIGYKVKNLMGSKSKYWEEVVTSCSANTTTEHQNLTPENYSLIAENQVLISERQNLTLKRPESIEKSTLNFPSEIYSEINTEDLEKELDPVGVAASSEDPPTINQKDLDPVVGTDQQVGRERKPASNLTDADTLDATPLDWKEVKERLIKKTEELVPAKEEFKRIRLWTDEGTLDARLYVVDLLPKEYETLRSKKHGSSEQEYEQYKILLLNELSDSIIASFEAREAMSTSLTA